MQVVASNKPRNPTKQQFKHPKQTNNGSTLTL
jgi:hypothetical protein